VIKNEKIIAISKIILRNDIYLEIQFPQMLKIFKIMVKQIDLV